MLLPAIEKLTERQHQLFFVFHTVVARHKPEGFARLVDDDVADAAAALASTLETASRGVIYEHQAQSVVAQRLVRELQATLAEMREKGATIYDGEAAIALRAIERGARDTRKAAPGETAYIELMGRLLQGGRPARSGASAEEPARPPSPLILP